MTRSIRAGLFAAFFIPASAVYPQAPSFDEAQRRAIGEIVREYLLANPEVLQEAISVLEQRQQDAQLAAQTAALETEREAIFRSPWDYVIGNPNGDVTLVEFLDYNCAYCKRAATDLKALIKADSKLRVTLKDFPVLGPESLEASRVALATKQQLKGDQSFDFHMKLMEARGRVNGERAKALAKEFNVDMARLEKDLQSDGIKAAIQANIALGEKLGITGTPAFIIGRDVIPGAVGVDTLQQAVANVRKCGRATCG